MVTNVSQTLLETRSLHAGGPSRLLWAISGLLDFVLHALRALSPCEPRPHQSQANAMTQADSLTWDNSV